MSKTKGNVTEKEFNNMKLLQQAEVKASKASELTGRSWTTIQRMYDAKTFEDYCAVVAAANKKYKEIREAREQAKQAVAEVTSTVPVKVEVQDGESEAVTLLRNLTDEVQHLKQGITELNERIEETTAVRKSTFWVRR